MRFLLVLALLATAAFGQTVSDCEKHARYGRLAEAKACYAALSRSADPAVRAEGLWHTGDMFGSNEAFKLAVKQHPTDAALRVRWGNLYFEHEQPSDAGDLYQEALKIKKDYAPAMTGMARVMAKAYDKRAAEMAGDALKADPKYVEAQELLAFLALEDNNSPKAIEEADKALKISSEALDALAVRASVELLEDKPADEWLNRLFKINPNYGQAWATIGHFYDINRRYEESIASYRKALELQPQLWSARAELGVNLMRQGLDKEAREHLEMCFENGYRGPTTVNSLRLMDSYKTFETFTTPVSILRLKSKEAAVLRPYVEEEIQLALATYDKKYKMKLNAPVQVEMYPDHEDFAVRTMGMPGLGALGVTFGMSIAMDSPSGRSPGTFHWASTLWHEMSHVYVLTATHHRVPRWFTEGVAVYEETATHPDWGDRLDPGAINAIKGKKLLPITELDRGFIHPSYPQQVVISYFQGGQICIYIVERWGWDKILAMIQDFSKHAETADVIQKELGVSPAEFDKAFLEWLEKRTKVQVENFDTWKTKMKELSEAVSTKKWDEVIAKGSVVRDLYPDYIENGNAYEVVAEAYKEKGDKTSAMRELLAYSNAGGKNSVIVKKLADLQIEAGLKKEAVASLERLNYIYPQDEELHTKLGGLYLEMHQTKLAVREFEVLLAGKPTDPAAARYELAQAYKQAGRFDDARSQVLDALEAAPNFRPAQKLLLELTKGKPQ